ncbi:DUF6635 family protein [Celeribacter indicus]|uniref:DUF6635 family protein n=1 Tax=Celeribacter indicus TaxID=1208324 RepID=UPI0006934B6F|nr:DUF6635 family protein [Celeribacter indicus]SDW30236.1 hypothetical protein SAMN05443573_102318 [Celeribacter indicus]
MPRDTTIPDPEAALRRFVRDRFGPRGTLRLHRAAFGLDLLRAPVNVLLAPVFLIVRLLALLASRLRARRIAAWLGARRVFLETDMAREVARSVTAFLETDGPQVPTAIRHRAVEDYVGVRGAVAEITTTLLVLLAGALLFHTATPGILSLVAPVSELRAHALAVENFPLGRGLGRVYYSVFPTALPLWQGVVTGVLLAMAASVVTTFAGLIADPVQVATGVHRRRLRRLIDRIAAEREAGLAREHVAARAADLSDLAVNLWRLLRG